MTLLEQLQELALAEITSFSRRKDNDRFVYLVACRARACAFNQAAFLLEHGTDAVTLKHNLTMWADQMAELKSEVVKSHNVFFVAHIAGTIQGYRQAVKYIDSYLAIDKLGGLS